MKRTERISALAALACVALGASACDLDGKGTLEWKGRAFALTYSQLGEISTPAPLPAGTSCHAVLVIQTLGSDGQPAAGATPKVNEKDLLIGEHGEFSIEKELILTDNIKKNGVTSQLTLNCGGEYTAIRDFVFSRKNYDENGYKKSQVKIAKDLDRAVLKLEKWKTVDARIRAVQPVLQFEDPAEKLEALFAVDRSLGSVYFMVPET